MNDDRLNALSDVLSDAPMVPNARYSKAVRVLRLTLPIIAVLLVGVVFMASEQRDFTPTPRENVLDTPDAQTELLNPRFESADRDKQPFTITAQKATQDQAEPDLIHLQKPVADMTLRDGTWLAIEAATGLYRQDVQTLQLSGGMRLFHDSGYELISDAADLDMLKQTAVTHGTVHGQGPVGTIHAQKLTADGATGSMVFDGPAKLVLFEAVLR